MIKSLQHSSSSGYVVSLCSCTRYPSNDGCRFSRYLTHPRGRRCRYVLFLVVVMIYITGSLRNSQIPIIGNKLRELGQEVFDDWHSVGPEADDKWKEYEQRRGRSYREALQGYAARHVFSFDRAHLDRADAVLLVLPAGRSGHLELGYAVGQGKKGYILLDDPDRWDVMYQFAFINEGNIFFNEQELYAHFTTATAQPTPPTSAPRISNPF